MTPEAADWVYDVVITRRYKEAAGAIMWTGAGSDRRDEGKGATFLRTCPCQYGPCGRCGDGRPERCAHRAWSPPFAPETWIHSHHGNALNRVWRAGKPCAWLCTTVTEAGLGQLQLFATGGAR